MYITFKGATSDSKNVIIESFNWFTKPQKRTDVRLIDGKDGAVVTELGYAPLVLSCVIGLKSTANVDEVIAWLDGSGVLKCSDDALKFRNAMVLEQVDYQKLIRFRKAEVEFYVKDPFRYLVTETPQVVSTFPGAITNAGSVYTRPKLTIEGSGAISVTLNGTTFDYTFPTGENVVIDCDTMDATYNGALRNQYMSGNFPILAVGSNALSVSGTVTSITVTNHTRFL